MLASCFTRWHRRPFAAVLSGLLLLIPSAGNTQTQARARQFGNIIITPGAGKSEAQFAQEIAYCSSLKDLDHFTKCMLGVDLSGTHNRADFASNQAPPPQRTQTTPTYSSRNFVAPTTTTTSRNTEAAGYAKILDGIVAQDSETWAVNRYQRGSMTNATIVSGSPTGPQITVRGYYTYMWRDESKTGWVDAVFVNGKLSCIRYHDYPDDCRAPRDIREIEAAQRRMAAAQEQQERRERAQQSAWQHLSLSQRQRQCEPRCQTQKEQCESSNSARHFAQAMGGINLADVRTMMWNGATETDCAALRASCLGSCITSGN